MKWRKSRTSTLQLHQNCKKRWSNISWSNRSKVKIQRLKQLNLSSPGPLKSSKGTKKQFIRRWTPWKTLLLTSTRNFGRSKNIIIRSIHSNTLWSTSKTWRCISAMHQLSSTKLDEASLTIGLVLSHAATSSQSTPRTLSLFHIALHKGSATFRRNGSKTGTMKKSRLPTKFSKDLKSTT